MDREAQEFSRMIGAILGRFFAQNGSVVPATFDSEGFGARLGQIVAERGLPGAVKATADQPVKLSDKECAPLVARVLGGAPDALLATAAQQLVKACLYPELTQCRDSFREVTADGACRRQELARVRGRVSGTHCVDCPHWIALTPTEHAGYLKREWRSAEPEFTDHQTEFLPEDFRALRRWLHRRAHVSSSAAQ